MAKRKSNIAAQSWIINLNAVSASYVVETILITIHSILITAVEVDISAMVIMELMDICVLKYVMSIQDGEMNMEGEEKRK